MWSLHIHKPVCPHRSPTSFQSHHQRDRERRQQPMLPHRSLHSVIKRPINAMGHFLSIQFYVTLFSHANRPVRFENFVALMNNLHVKQLFVSYLHLGIVTNYSFCMSMRAHISELRTIFQNFKSPLRNIMRDFWQNGQIKQKYLDCNKIKYMPRSVHSATATCCQDRLSFLWACPDTFHFPY